MSTHPNKEEKLAVIRGKTTCSGFNVRALSPIQRNSFLAISHEEKTYILRVQKIWREKETLFADLRVIGDIPDVPFKTAADLRLANPDEIKEVLGLEDDPEKSMHLGKIIGTDILSTFNIEDLGRLFITGRSGSGKSHTVGVVIEELIKKQIPIVIFDRHGEYSSLKYIKEEKIPKDDPFFDIEDPKLAFARFIVEFGDPDINPGVDLNLNYLLACEPIELIAVGQCTIINLRGLDLTMQKNITEIILTRLYDASVKRIIPPGFIFIDEAHELAGKKKEPVMEKVRLIAQEGRKFGLNLVIISQRPQALDVTLRAQAGTWIIHKLTDINDVQITCKSSEGLSVKDYDDIQVLSVGEAIISGEITLSTPLKVRIRERITYHGGAGYNVLDYVQHGELYESELIKSLKRKIKPKQLEASKSIKKISSMNLKEIQNELKNKNIEIKSLKSEIAEIRSKHAKEKKRADDAITLAEKLLDKLKRKS